MAHRYLPLPDFHRLDWQPYGLRAKNTKTNGLILNVERRSDFPPLKSLLRSFLCALCFLWPQFHFGVRVKNLFVLPALIAVLALIPAGRVTAQTFTTLHSFMATSTNSSGVYTNSDGANPVTVVITKSSCNTLYGTANIGGSSGNGMVF